MGWYNVEVLYSWSGYFPYFLEETRVTNGGEEQSLTLLSWKQGPSKEKRVERQGKGDSLQEGDKICFSGSIPYLLMLIV